VHFSVTVIQGLHDINVSTFESTVNNKLALLSSVSSVLYEVSASNLVVDSVVSASANSASSRRYLRNGNVVLTDDAGIEVTYTATVASSVYGVGAESSANNLVASLNSAIDSGLFDSTLSHVSSHDYDTVGMEAVTSGAASVEGYADLTPTPSPTTAFITTNANKSVFYTSFPLYGRVLFPFGCIVIGMIVFYSGYRCWWYSSSSKYDPSSSGFLRTERFVDV
jgi:hypothetical protein